MKGGELMWQNMSSKDRLIRIVLAVVLALLNLTGVTTGNIGIAAWIVAAILVITAAIGYCPLYKFFEISTKK